MSCQTWWDNTFPNRSEASSLGSYIKGSSVRQHINLHVLDHIFSLEWRIIDDERISSFLLGAETGRFEFNLNCISPSFISATSLTPLIQITHCFLSLRMNRLLAMFGFYRVSESMSQPPFPISSVRAEVANSLSVHQPDTQLKKSDSNFSLSVSDNPSHVCHPLCGGICGTRSRCLRPAAQWGTVTSCKTWGQREGETSKGGLKRAEIMNVIQRFITVIQKVPGMLTLTLTSVQRHLIHIHETRYKPNFHSAAFVPLQLLQGNFAAELKQLKFACSSSKY